MRSGGTQTPGGLTEDTGTVIYRRKEDCEERRNTDTERTDGGHGDCDISEKGGL